MSITVESYAFGDIIVETGRADEDDCVTVALNYSLGLGNNFSYQNYIDELVSSAEESDYEEDPIYYILMNVTLDDDVIIVDLSGATLNTCGSDLLDHLRI